MTMRSGPTASVQADAPPAPVMTMAPNPTAQVQATPAPVENVQMAAAPAAQVQETPKPWAPPINTTKPGDVGPNGPSANGQTGLNPGGAPTQEPVTAAPKPDVVAPPTDTPVTAPVKTEPSLDDNMAQYEKIAMDWANGVVDDKVFRTTANRAILQMGLNNQAETDALQMRINQDPALKGQGAGAALLSMMAANHNFSADQMFGQLAQSAQEKILDMQKYGLQEGIAINNQRRQNDYTKLGMLQDAGDFAGAASLAAKIADFPGVSISPSSFTANRTRMSEDASSLAAAGNYAGAAAKLAALTGQAVDPAALQSRDPFVWKQAQMLEDKGDFTGAAKIYAANGLNITADDLRARDPFQQQTWTNTLDSIKATASTDPARAETQLDILMKNPAAAEYLGFQAGTSAHDLIQSIVTGKYQAEQTMREGLQTEINKQAKSNVGFSQALVNYKALGPAAWDGMTMDGKKMAGTDLDNFNAARQSLGMSAVHKDAQGNVVDANGHALQDEDFAETAAAADYTSRTAAIKQQPWQVAYDNLMAAGSPMAERILSIPGGKESVKESLQMLYLGGGYKLDPQTQTMVPDYTGGMPWENPSTAHIFHNWPLAQFGADGSVQGKYDLGGEVYGDTVGDSKIQKMPDDTALDDAYAKYKYNKGTLDASSWYFATAGGTKPEDATKIPAELANKDLTQVGTTTGTTGTTPTDGTVGADGTITPKTGSTADTFKQFDDLLKTTGGYSSDDLRDAAGTYMKTMSTAYNNAKPGTVVPLNVGSKSSFDAAITRLKSHGITNFEGIVNRDRSSDSGTMYDYKGTQAFVDYSLYTKLLGSMKEGEAKAALAKLIDPTRLSRVMELESGDSKTIGAGNAIDNLNKIEGQT